MADLEHYYDVMAESIAREWYSNGILMPTHQDFMTLLPTRPRILDFGCGPGYEAMRLHDLGADVVGIDISAKSIEIARLKNPACEFLKMDFHAIDQSIGCFDGVLASGSLIHVEPERMSGVLSSIRNLLRPGGVLAALVRDGNGSIKRQQVAGGHTMEWIAWRYTSEVFTMYCNANDLRFIRDGVLDEVLLNAGWRCYFYRAETP
jgi:2-polyprenyl-3-methyl-5-hydroxy-6-metoxy-1,4-benzoquinol methylase